MPIGAEADFHGVIDLLGDTATHYDTPAPNVRPSMARFPPAIGREGPIPDELVDEEHTVHEQLVEGIVVGDDGLMELFATSAAESIDYGELAKSLAGGVASGSRLPGLVLFGPHRCGGGPVGPPDRGTLPYAPGSAPPMSPCWRGRPPTEIPCDASRATCCLTVTKTFTDSHTGKMSLCKVISGTLTPDTVLINTRTRGEERLHALQTLSGHATAPTVTSVVAGRFSSPSPA